MDFYSTLSLYYDDLFPVDVNEMAFLRSLVVGSGDLLDIGCGTGNKTVYFSDAVGRITAFDNDAKMIELARRDNPRPNIRYEVFDMAGMSAGMPGASFNAALCLGNTLVHLDGLSAIAAFLQSVHDVLRPQGVFVLQILNYDRILNRHVENLPLLESRDATFSRSYRPEGDRLHFLTRLNVLASGESFENDVLLYPLRSRELLELLDDAGFSRPVLHGDFQGGPYREDSFVCLAVCRRESS